MEKELTAIQQLINTAIEFCVNYSFQVIGALIILVIGVVAANWTAGLLLKIFEKKNLDITLSKFLVGVVKIVILAFAIIIALGKFGITIAPFVAALGALAFGASFAIQGPLSNYGAGLTIIITRPFVVGNTITVAGVSGVVTEVKLACTILTDEDGIKITIPNKHIVGEIIHNSQTNRIVESVIGISYDSEPEAAIRAISQTLAGFQEVGKDPKPQIGIQEFADSSVNIGFRYWVPTVKYYQTLHKVNLAVYKAVQVAGAKIPFPQRDIHIVSQPSGMQTLNSSR
ncbi:MAG: mechanosensitive ion channel family protein [Candidatus Omnitrophica bacterium]|nr:mechanosensitive ion channel family protein [Candidatus Omnitrophota bacterium]